MLDHTLNLSLDNDRHLIVGDLHGRYDQLLQLLDKANYDSAKDIVYSVGDLIDRGPKSVECVEFFQQERCYAIKGNHELMCLDRDWYDVWVRNGGIQCMDSVYAHGYDHEWLKDQVRDLPWVIDVGEPGEEHAFRIVHAEQPPAWSDAYLKTTLDSAISHSDPTFSHIVWSRKLIEAAKKNVQTMKPSQYGIEFHPDRHRKIFAGHTPHRNIIRVGDHWFLDTWTGGIQSMIDAVTLEKFTIKYR